MRWGAASREPGSLRWVRPLQSILCVFGPENGETAVIDFEIAGIRSGDRTVGHRFHAPAEFKVRRFEDYISQLEKAYVVLDAERRKEIIRTDADNLAFAQGLEVVADEGLLEEVSGLVEWPVVLVGEFEETFLEIPPEMIQLTIRTNQKCFVTRRRGADGLSNRFLMVANIEAADHGAEIARGNGKVVRARLSDALYFWKTDQGALPDVAALEASAARFGLDLGKPLDQRMAKLDALGVTFHAKLGTQGQRVSRIADLAEVLAPLVGAEPAAARRAAVLAKADLTTEAVGEFPELQGLMGQKYAALQGEADSVQRAIVDHYKPQGPGDGVPSDKVAVAVALADKLDTLVGFWSIDEKPTGSKDPYALRRAALGVIRIILDNELRLRLGTLLTSGDLCPSSTTAEGPASRPGRAARPRGRRARRGGRGEGRPSRRVAARGRARPPAGDRRRREPSGRLSPRREHPCRRGEEGHAGRALRRSRALRRDRGAGAPLRHRAGRGRTRGRHGRGGLHARHGGARQAAPARRRLLREGAGECRGRGRARQPPRASLAHPLGGRSAGRSLARRGITIRRLDK